MRLILGDSREELRGLDPDSIDALVTDPPAGIGFMGKAFDSDRGGRDKWITWLAEIMMHASYVMKPGAHGLVWALPRTSHWTATALENAGFEIRDVIMHVFGSGFPKSLNLPDGIGTALKPAAEHWILVRKPLAGTVAANVLEHGTGGLNVDACRVEGAPESTRFDPTKHSHAGWRMAATGAETAARAEGASGRWPPHLLLTHSAGCGDRFPGPRCVADCPVRIMDEQSGELRSGGFSGVVQQPRSSQTAKGTEAERARLDREPSAGGASRFFPRFRYQPKPSRAEREAGCEHLPARTPPAVECQGDFDKVGLNSPRAGAGRTASEIHNHHPTLKSLDLMRWLVRLITPPGGTVLDPFMGSGTTGCACACEGFDFVGIEQDPEYVQIARARIEHYSVARHEIENDDSPRPQAVGQGSLW